jgi:hypothetical protein
MGGFKWNLKDWDVDCINNLAQDRNHFWAFVNLCSSGLVLPRLYPTQITCMHSPLKYGFNSSEAADAAARVT